MKTRSCLSLPPVRVLADGILLLCLVACGGSAVVIRPGGGFDAAPARALAAGQLSNEPEGEVAETADAAPARRTFPGPATPATVDDPQAPRPADAGGVSALDDVTNELDDEFTRTGGEAEEVDEAAPDSVSGPQTWQRDAQRPSFARVYVGDGNSLDLQRMRVTVTIEGPRARTVVDHVFRNPHDQTLEGTFEYPLPAAASPCYFAMFLTDSQDDAPELFPEQRLARLPDGLLAMMAPEQAARIVDTTQWGELREARVVARDTARQVYEQIVRRDIDPALLEYASGSTFRGRVFPIEPGSYNRVILAYEQHLDVADGEVAYRFPLPDCDLDLLHVTVTLPAGDASAVALAPDGARRRTVDDRVVFDHAWEAERAPGGELVLSYAPARAELQAIAGADPTSDLQAFYLRFRPELPAKLEAPWARQAVFVLDTSLSEAPDRFRANLAVLSRILERDAAIERFNVCCFDVGATWLEPGGWIDNDPAGRQRSLDQLDRILLEGATDVGAAVELLCGTRWGERAPTYVFVLTDGELTWGEQDPRRLAARLDGCAGFDARVFCYRTGLSAENLELFEQLTRRGGAVFNVFTAAMAEEVALAHRRPALLIDSVEVRDAQGRAVRDLLVAGRKAALHPGGELVVAGRDAELGQMTLAVTGSFQGDAKSFELPVGFASGGALAARGWAEIAIQQLLARHDPDLELLATAYAQHFHVASRVTSFLVLETDEEYEQYGIDEQRAALQVDDLRGFLDRVYRGGAAPTARKAAFEHLFVARLGLQAADAGDVRALWATMDEQDFALPPGVAAAATVLASDADPAYVAARLTEDQAVDASLAEARRRLDQDLVFAGLRALSNIPERHPGRSDALRLVGYRLLSFAQQGAACWLFDQVLQQRPFEPHSWRDLARSLQRAGRFPLAALCYEVLLAGSWDRRFHGSLLVVAREEYVQLLRDGLLASGLSPAVIDVFGQRVEELSGDEGAADLRVTISWNTDSTDVDLWVVEPSGEACGYENPETRSGGQLLDDLTEGYGPERYRIVDAPQGQYSVLVHYFGANPNLIRGETHVEVVVTTRAGRPDQQTRRFTVVLEEENQAYEVCVVNL